MSENDRLIYLVFTAQQKLRTHLKRALDEERMGVTPAQVAILFVLADNDGATMTELSQVLSADNSTVTGLIDRLEKSGYVTRTLSDTDRRTFKVFITPEGKKEARKALRPVKKVNEYIKEGFSKDEIETFKKVLQSFFTKFG